MRRVVVSRWFGLADLVLVLLSTSVCVAWPKTGWLPLGIALLPWAGRLAAGRFPVRRTAFDISLGFFLLTALVGVWAAYDPPGAWVKFRVISGSILLFYALANQPKKALWSVAKLFSLAGALLAIYFSLTNDWQAQPADLAALNRLALRWMSIRPATSWPALQANMAGGILAMLFPFSLAVGLRARSARNLWTELSYAALCAALIAGGLLLTSSRGAWLALLVGLGFWTGGSFSRAASARWGRPVGRLLLPLCLFTGLLALGWGFQTTGGLVGLANRLPGPASGGSRLNLALDALRLIGDFPWTGGGLGSFAGLYSQYIEVIPFFQFSYSHNFLLDVSLEQGVFAGVTVVGVYMASLWLAARQAGVSGRNSLLTWAALASLLSVILHGLVDDALYGGPGTPLLFLLPGFVIALKQTTSSTSPGNSTPGSPAAELKLSRHARLWVWSAAILLGALGLLTLVWGEQLLASGYANLGAVEMARLELQGWPINRWNQETDISPLLTSRERFRQAIELHPRNRTAWHRLGLIALQARDFETARVNLEQAYTLDPGHRGLQKSLGYTLAWSGRVVQAAELLGHIPGAKHELQVYIGWWSQLGREDLADYARKTAELIKN